MWQDKLKTLIENNNNKKVQWQGQEEVKNKQYGTNRFSV